MLTRAQVAGKLQSRYEALGGKQAIDWAAVLRLILGLFAGCTVADVKAAAKAHPAFVELMLASALKREMPEIKLKDRLLIAKASVVEFNAAKTKDIEILL